MTETKTNIRELFVDISSLLFVSRSAGRNVYCENERAAQPTAVRTVCDCVELGI